MKQHPTTQSCTSEATDKRSAINLRFLVHGNIPLLGAMLLLFRLVVLSTAYLIPQYLVTIQGYRALETGDVLLLIALPQFVLAPVIGTLLRFMDPRLLMAAGFALIGGACFMAAVLTGAWVGGDFLPSQVLQALGQSFGLTALVWFAARHLSPAEALTFGAFLQTARLMGGELGIAFMQTYVRVQEQAHSFLIGLHIDAGSAMTAARLQAYAAAEAACATGAAEAGARSMALLARVVADQANVLAYADGFRLLGFVVVFCLGLIPGLRIQLAVLLAERLFEVVWRPSGSFAA